MAQWIPATFVADVAFIFHVDDLWDGKNLFTEGVRNAYYCHSKWSSNQLRSSTINHPYFSIFDHTRVESYANKRVWGVIEKIQDIFIKLMGQISSTQALSNSSNCCQVAL